MTVNICQMIHVWDSDSRSAAPPEHPSAGSTFPIAFLAGAALFYEYNEYNAGRETGRIQEINSLSRHLTEHEIQVRGGSP